MDNWSTHPALADDDSAPPTPIVPNSPRNAMNLTDRVNNYLKTRPHLASTASAVGNAISRPSSVLSGDSAVTEDSHHPTNTGYLSSKDVLSTLKRDERKCLLCGTAASELESLQVIRVAWNSEDDESIDPSIAWLEATRSLTHRIERNDSSNLMTLCSTHATHYINRKWRFIPTASEITAIVASDKEDQQICKQADDNGQPLPPRILPNLNNEFEVFVARLEESIISAATLSSSTPAIEQPKCRTFRLPIDPYLALVSGLDIALGAYRPMDDRASLLEHSLINARDAFNERYAPPI